MKRIPGLKTAKKTAMWLKNRIYPGAIILGYHRIAGVDIDSFENCVSPDHFAQQMEVISRYTKPNHLEKLTASLDVERPSARTVCVTIDDGYIDTLINAKPILEQYNVPATVFVTTGNLGGEFWWDELERTILDAPEDVNLLRLEVNERVSEWDFAKLNGAKRTSQIVSIANFLRSLGGSIRRQQLNKIQEWARAGDKSPRVRSMTSDELNSLVEGGLIQIGSHSVSHPIFSELSTSERRSEMKDSKYILEEIISKPVLGFSYPNGLFQAGDPDLVFQSGYRYACTSQNGTVRSNTDRYAIPRFWPRDTDGESFHRWLNRWL